MAINFGPQARYERAETPQFAAAAAAEGRQASAAKQQANALRSQNFMGAADLYNAGMGDRTPIGDAFFDKTPNTSKVLDGGMAGGDPFSATTGAADPYDLTLSGSNGGALDIGSVGAGAAEAEALAANVSGAAGPAGIAAEAAAAELATGLELGATAAELGTAGTAAAGTAAGGLSSSLAAANPYIAAALLGYNLFG
jgi:hypothetical protein